MIKLPPNQELFAQSLASGVDKKDAYRQVFKADDLDDKKVSANALRMSKKVQDRVDEIVREIVDRLTWTRDESILVLSEIAKSPKQKTADRISAVKELNAMHGFNAPVQHRLEHTHQVTMIELVSVDPSVVSTQ